MTFFQAADNAGYVKINFISDDGVAIAMNEASRQTNAPTTSSPSFAGGYTYPILDNLSNHDGAARTYQILKAPLPKEGSSSHLRQILHLLDQPETLYAYVDAGAVTMVQIENWDRRATPLSKFGWQITNGPKTFKRLKTFNRPFRLWAQLDRPLRIHLVDADAYTNEDVSDYDEAVVERLLDGGFVISRELFNHCLDNVKFPKLPDESTSGFTPELMLNHYRAEEYMRQAQYFRAFNARFVGPMHFGSLHHDDDLWHTPGMLKGEAFLDVAGTCERMHVDVICTRSALKFEVANTLSTFLMIEPQKAKRQNVSSDLQTMVSLPAVFQFEDVSNWTREFLETWLEKLKRDEIMEEWFTLAAYKFNNSTYQYNENDVETLTKWNARAWLMSGRRITESPWMFEQMGRAIAKKLRTSDLKRLRFPIPCAAYAQVISQSFASMAGCDLDIDYNQARWCEELEALVVNDIDWLEMYESHGGHDLDDFFKIVWRRIDGELKIIVVRSPNDWGEYTVFDYVDGDWYPTGRTASGEEYSFPEVSSDPSLWAERLSEVLARNGIIYTGLPSKNNPTPKSEPHPYSTTDVLAQIENNRASTTCVGANVNARILWSLAAKDHRPQQLTSMEDCIDTGTQGGSLEDAEAVMAEADDIVKRIIANPELQIDQFVWMTRFQQIKGIPFDRARLTDQTDVSKAHAFRGRVFKSFMEKVRDYAGRELASNVDINVHRLGMARVREGLRVLKETRAAMFMMNAPDDQTLVPGDWGDVHAGVLTRIEAYEKLSDRYDFVLGLYSACLKVPTGYTKRISDQLVMNPHVFPYLLEAMRFYGLAYYVNVTAEGNIERSKNNPWDLKCVKCGESWTVTDPVTVQAFHMHDETCKTCREEGEHIE